jgi:hypothetical protein
VLMPLLLMLGVGLAGVVVCLFLLKKVKN